jgi:hypothetical protein
MGALHQAKAEQQDQHSRAAVADQWQWDTYNGRKPHDHGHIHRKEQKEGDAYAKGQ